MRPLLNRQEVMDATEAAEFTGVLRPRLAVPVHYAFTSGPLGDRVMTESVRNRPDLYRDAAGELAAPPRTCCPPVANSWSPPERRNRPGLGCKHAFTYR